jgi:hypothetical protein
MLHFVTEKKMYLFVLGKNCPFMTNNKNLGKGVKNQKHKCTMHRNTTNSFIPLGSNVQFSTKHRKRTSNNNKNMQQ